MDREGLPKRNVHYRVDFVVREVCSDGSVAEEELRYVQLGDDMHRGDVFDYFNRVRDAVMVLFPSVGPVVLCLDDAGQNKIALIKAVRAATRLGLKASKDLVEAPLGTALLAFDDPHWAADVARLLEREGAKVAMRAERPSDELERPRNSNGERSVLCRVKREEPGSSGGPVH